MKEYLMLGHMKLATDQTVDDGYFLPHHAVLKKSSLTTKLGVVFDASAKTSSGYSLNDCLRIGPNIQDDLFSTLIRFRGHKIVLTAEIAKMYRLIQLHENKRKHQRILWRDNTDEAVKVYELQTVTYGTAPAAFLAIRCLQEIALQGRRKFPEAAEVVLKDVYVDHLLTGADYINEAVKLQVELSALLDEGGMELRKLTPNTDEVLQLIVTNTEERDAIVLTWDKADNVKTLGL